ncbi:hypothetical protein GCM10010464_07580 [Pseudonocardia yunnanensis]
MRTAAHTGQPQFHCGEPPPAAEPSTRSNIVVTPLSTEEPPPEGVGSSDMRRPFGPAGHLWSRRAVGGLRTRSGPAPPYVPLVVQLGDVHRHLGRDADLLELRRLPHSKLRLHGFTSSLSA